ncbi:MAG: hypothetical protein ACJ71Z_05340 [Aeromicrobium sp.]
MDAQALWAQQQLREAFTSLLRVPDAQATSDLENSVVSDFIQEAGAEQALHLSAATAAAMIGFLSETPGIDAMDFIQRMLASKSDGQKFA